MKRLKRRIPELSRERLVNPYKADYADRVFAAGATDLHENFRMEELRGGYSRIVPVNASRKVGQ